MSVLPDSAPDSGVRLSVAVEMPQHSNVGGPLDYLAPSPLPPGTLVRVPLGTREVPGIVWGLGSGAGDNPANVSVAANGPSVAALRPIGAVLSSLPPLSADWCRLVEFTALEIDDGL